MIIKKYPSPYISNVKQDFLQNLLVMNYNYEKLYNHKILNQQITN